MPNLFIDIAQVNETKHYHLCDHSFEETRFDDMGELYRSLVKEYGKCVSKQYIDVNDKPTQIGWVFEKRVVYDDVRPGKSLKHMTQEDKDKCSFICSTWISVHSSKPSVTRISHFAKF